MWTIGSSRRSCPSYTSSSSTISLAGVHAPRTLRRVREDLSLPVAQKPRSITYRTLRRTGKILGVPIVSLRISQTMD